MRTSLPFRNGQFCWVDLNAHDAVRAAAFYQRVFGWTATPIDTQGGPPYWMFELNNLRVAGLGQMSDEMKGQGIPPIWNSYVRVADCQATMDRAIELGGTTVVPCMQILDAAYLAFFQDPTGATLALWQKLQLGGAEAINAPGFFCWNELVTRDVERATGFYRDLFHWRFENSPHSPTKYYIAMQGPNAIGGLTEMRNESVQMLPRWSVYFQVGDARVTSQRIKEHGGRVSFEPIDSPIGLIAGAEDPQAGPFQLCQPSGNAA